MLELLVGKEVSYELVKHVGTEQHKGVILSIDDNDAYIVNQKGCIDLVPIIKLTIESKIDISNNIFDLVYSIERLSESKMQICMNDTDTSLKSDFDKVIKTMLKKVEKNI
jgi:hypothetical protein